MQIVAEGKIAIREEFGLNGNRGIRVAGEECVLPGQKKRIGGRKPMPESTLQRRFGMDFFPVGFRHNPQ